MQGHSGRPLGSWRKALLASASVVTFGSPLVAGMLNASQRDAQLLPDLGSPRTFEVASVKPNGSPEGFVQLGIQPGGLFTASNVPLRMLIPCLVSLALFAALQLFLTRTFLGRAIMAVSQDQLALRLMAVDPVNMT